MDVHGISTAYVSFCLENRHENVKYIGEGSENSYKLPIFFDFYCCIMIAVAGNCFHSKFDIKHV